MCSNPEAENGKTHISYYPSSAGELFVPFSFGIKCWYVVLFGEMEFARKFNIPPPDMG